MNAAEAGAGGIARPAVTWEVSGMKKLAYKLAMIQVAACDLGSNIRTMVNDGEIGRLAESLKKRQVHPLIVLVTEAGKYLVIDGGKRVRAAVLAGIGELLAVVTDEPLTPEEIIHLQLVAAFHRSDPSNVDKWRAMEAIKAAHPDWSNAALAQDLAIDPKMVKVLLSPGQVAAEVREAFCDRQINLSVCHELSLIPSEAVQRALLDRAITGKLSRDQVARLARRLRLGLEELPPPGDAEPPPAAPADEQEHGTVPSPRKGKMRIPLPSGVVVTLAGNELAIDDAIRELKAAIAKLKEAKKKQDEAASLADERRGGEAA